MTCSCSGVWDVCTWQSVWKSKCHHSAELFVRRKSSSFVLWKIFHADHVNIREGSTVKNCHVREAYWRQNWKHLEIVENCLVSDSYISDLVVVQLGEFITIFRKMELNQQQHSIENVSRSCHQLWHTEPRSSSNIFTNFRKRQAWGY